MMQPSAELLLMPTNHKLIYFNEVDKGGHFATWEQPELFATEFRAAFRSLRWLDRGAAARTTCTPSPHATRGATIDENH